jgi:hypothetical protein
MLVIDHVHNLVRIAEFSKLTSVKGEFVISVNEALTELPPPASMVTITGSLQIVYNPSLPTCMAKSFAMSVSGSGPTTVSDNKVDACGG